MDITLDKNDINVFKTLINKFTCLNSQLNVNTNYNILYTLLQDVPKVLLNIICEYAEEKYIIKYQVNNNFKLDTIEDDISLKVCSKILCIYFCQIKVNDITHYPHTSIDYEFIISNNKYNYNIHHFPSHKSVRKTNSHLELDNTEYLDHFSNILVFVVNKLLDIMIGEGINIVVPAYR